MTDSPTCPLIVVSNRMPVVLSLEGDRWHATRASGGLVSAMEPVMRERGGAWIGWPGAHPAPEQIAPDLHAAVAGAFEPQPVWIDPDEFNDYYEGFANSIIWPLFHGLSEHCDFEQSFFDACLRVTERFAAEVQRTVTWRPESVIWVHDYQLIFLGESLRRLEIDRPIGFFLHIPFPPPMLLSRLPWRDRVLRGLLEYDHVGLQSERDLVHFCECLSELAPQLTVHRDSRGATVETESGRRVRIAVHPIGIAAGEMERLAQRGPASEAVERLRGKLAGRKLLLGVDRLDYSKGIPERLGAFERLLEQHPDLVDKVLFAQIVVPSRENVPAYAKLKCDIDREVGRINGAYSTLSGLPIQYIYGSVPRQDLAQLMALADVAVVTPLCDGMNLVAKEYCDAQYRENGVLVLSEMAGAAEQLKEWAITVNPYDVNAVASALRRAITMPQSERQRRMRALRESVRREDVFAWADGFVRALVASAERAPAPPSSLARPGAGTTPYDYDGATV